MVAASREAMETMATNRAIGAIRVPVPAPGGKSSFSLTTAHTLVTWNNWLFVSFRERSRDRNEYRRRNSRSRSRERSSHYRHERSPDRDLYRDLINEDYEDKGSYSSRNNYDIVSIATRTTMIAGMWIATDAGNMIAITIIIVMTRTTMINVVRTNMTMNAITAGRTTIGSRRSATMTILTGDLNAVGEKVQIG